MIGEIIVMGLSFSICIAVFFFIKGGALNMLLRSHANKIDEKMDQAINLQLEAREMLLELEKKLSEECANEAKIVDKTIKDLEAYLEDKVKEAKEVGRQRLSMISIGLETERRLAMKRAADEAVGKIKEAVSAMMIDSRGGSSIEAVSNSDLNEIIRGTRKKLH